MRSCWRDIATAEEAGDVSGDLRHSFAKSSPARCLGCSRRLAISSTSSSCRSERVGTTILTSAAGDVTASAAAEPAIPYHSRRRGWSCVQPGVDGPARWSAFGTEPRCRSAEYAHPRPRVNLHSAFGGSIPVQGRVPWMVVKVRSEGSLDGLFPASA